MKETKKTKDKNPLEEIYEGCKPFINKKITFDIIVGSDDCRFIGTKEYRRHFPS